MKIDISIFISDLIELRRYPDISIIFIYFHMIFVFSKDGDFFFRSQLLHHTLYCITVLYFVKLFHKIFSHLKKEIYLDRVQWVHDTVLHNSSNGSYGSNLKKIIFFLFSFFSFKKERKLTCCHICAHTRNSQLLIFIEIHPVWFQNTRVSKRNFYSDLFFLRFFIKRYLPATCNGMKFIKLSCLFLYLNTNSRHATTRHIHKHSHFLSCAWILLKYVYTS